MPSVSLNELGKLVSVSDADAHVGGQCYANLECRVADTELVEKYCFLLSELSKHGLNPG